MGKKNLFQRLLLLPISGLLFVTSLSTPVSAIPTPVQTPASESTPTILESESNSSNSTTTDNKSSDTKDQAKEEKEDTTANCYSSVEGLSWLICPVISVISTAVDTLYGIINNFLVIKPITFNEESSIYIVWSISRDIANIVFIILILIVIFSQLTGIGFDNYNIKKTLPRLIIAAILVNISFIICSIAVDASNIIGASLTNFFKSITLTLQGGVEQQLAWTDIIGRIAGTAGAGIAATGIAAGAIAVTGGIGNFIFLVIPVVAGAAISLAIGVLTIALRQAVVALLVMIAPIAFVFYLLPNTEKYFAKWKDTLTQMLVFFPMFALLYGASNLAGWTFILNGDQNNNIFEILIGMAIQVFPLIFSLKLLKMSDTILGRVNDALTNFSQPLRNSINTFSATQAATKKAQYDAKNLSRTYTGLNRLNPANLRSFAAKRQFELAENRRLAEDTRQKILEKYNIARQMNKTIAFDAETGRAVLSKSTKTNGMTEAMRLVMENKEASLNLSSLELQRDNALGQPGNYSNINNIQSKELQTIIARQGQNFLEYKTEANAKRRNDQSDEQSYAKAVLDASRRDKDGNIINKQAYNDFIVRGGGINAGKLAEEKDRNNALASVIASAYDATEAERQSEIKRFTTYLDTQATERVRNELDRAISSNDVNNIIAGIDVLNKRGDGDLVTKHMIDYLNAGNLHLGTEESNNLALAFLQHGSNPLIKRLGKYINVETLRYTSGARGDNDVVTFKEFVTGKTDFYAYKDGKVVKDQNGNNKLYSPKFDIVSTLTGTPLNDVDRTAYDAIIAAEYSEQLDPERIAAIDAALMPQIVTAVPTYASGSEQITAAIKYLTGMSKDANGTWVSKFRTDPNGNDPRKDVDLDVFVERTTKYLKAFSPSDLIKFKSDVFAAVQDLYAEYYSNQTGEARDSQTVKNLVQDNLNQIFTDSGVYDTLASGDISALGGMKNAVRNYFHLDSQSIKEYLSSKNATN